MFQRLAGQYHIGVEDPTQPYMLCLQDPADPENDLGRKGYGFKHIQATLKHLHTNIVKALSTQKQAHALGNFSILDEAIGPCFERFQGRRAMAEDFGRKAVQDGLLGAPGEDVMAARGPPRLPGDEPLVLPLEESLAGDAHGALADHDAPIYGVGEDFGDTSTGLSEELARAIAVELSQGVSKSDDSVIDKRVNKLGTGKDKT